MDSMIVAECIPYRNFREKIKIVAEYLYGKRAKVEVMDGYVYVEYKEGFDGGVNEVHST